MPVVVELKDIIIAIDLPSQEWESFLDPESGEIVTITDEDTLLADSPDLDLDELPDWQRENVAKVREVEESGRFLRLPDSFDVHEWRIMRDFCGSVEDPEHREQLLDAVHGSGAFRFFKSTVDRLGLREEWFAYRDRAFERIARDWLEEHEIPYRDSRDANDDDTAASAVGDDET